MMVQEFGNEGVRNQRVGFSVREELATTKLEKYTSNLSDGIRTKAIWSEIENFEGTEFAFWTEFRM